MLALVVDDEKRARETICNMIMLYVPEIKEIIEADSVKEALHKIEKESPDLLFLDINLGDGNGFDVVEQLDSPLPVIFVTAYDQYVMKALKVSAVDYIMKPVDPEELVSAVNKAMQVLSRAAMQEQLQLFLNNVRDKETIVTKIMLKTMESIHIVKVEDIIYCQAERNYTTFKLLDDTEIIVSKNLREYEEILPQQDFMRPHQSYLVNVNHIIRYDKGEKNALVCHGEHLIPVSTRKRDKVLEMLKNIT
jgi:two-component system LytT family response regulator